MSVIAKSFRPDKLPNGSATRACNSGLQLPPFEQVWVEQKEHKHWKSAICSNLELPSLYGHLKSYSFYNYSVFLTSKLVATSELVQEFEHRYRSIGKRLPKFLNFSSDKKIQICVPVKKRSELCKEQNARKMQSFFEFACNCNWTSVVEAINQVNNTDHFALEEVVG